MITWYISSFTSSYNGNPRSQGEFPLFNLLTSSSSRSLRFSSSSLLQRTGLSELNPLSVCNSAVLESFVIQQLRAPRTRMLRITDLTQVRPPLNLRVQLTLQDTSCFFNWWINCDSYCGRGISALYYYVRLWTFGEFNGSAVMIHLQVDRIGWVRIKESSHSLTQRRIMQF